MVETQEKRRLEGFGKIDNKVDIILENFRERNSTNSEKLCEGDSQLNDSLLQLRKHKKLTLIIKLALEIF